MLVCNACPLGNACCLNKKSLFLNTITRTTQADSLAEVVEACKAIFYPEPGLKVRAFDSSWPDVTGSGGSTLSASQASSSCTSLLSPPSSSMAVKHGPCLLIQKKKDPSLQNPVPEETSPHLLLGPQDQRLGAKQDQLPFGSTGTSSGNCQELAWFGHVTRHDNLSKTTPQGILDVGRRLGPRGRNAG